MTNNESKEQRNGRRNDVALYLPNLLGGGAERVTLNLSRGLLARGLAVDLVVADLSGDLVHLIPPEVRVIDLGGTRTLRSLPALARYLRREKPTAFLSAMNHANLVAAWAAKFAGYRGTLVLAEHVQLAAANGSLWKALFNLAIRFTYPLATRVVAVSHGTKQSLIDNAGLKPDRTVVIYNPVLRDDFIRGEAFPRPPTMGSSDCLVFVGIGRLAPAKNFPLLISSFAKVRRDRDARLVILGEGTERLALEKLVADLALGDEVTLPGFVNNVMDYLSNANAFVLSSNHEGLPTVLIEALALGTPIVSTDCPSGPTEILRGGDYGRLVPMGDEESLAAAMLATLDEPYEPAPMEWLEQFTERAATDSYMTALGFTLPENPPPPNRWRGPKRPAGKFET